MNNAFTLTVATDGKARLIFDLPGEKVNKFSRAVVMELDELLKTFPQRKDIKILAIESAKPGVFIAGADINELATITTVQEGENKARSGQDLFNRLEALPFPTVAIINGACMGGGLELALACTYRLVTDSPKTLLACPEVQLGIVPGWGGTQRLPRLIGLLEGLPLILSGKTVPGPKALKLHLADACVATEFLEEEKVKFLDLCLTESGKRTLLSARQRSGLKTLLMENTPLGRLVVYSQAEKAILHKSGRHYPAPLTALRVVKDTFGGSLERGLQVEAKALGELAPTRTCKNLIQLFHTNEELKRDSGVSGKVSVPRITSGAVLGAGVMGGGIAWLLSWKDIPVRMKDINWDALCKGFASAMGYYGQLLKIKKMKPDAVRLKMGHISGAVDYSGFSNVDIVIEAIVENIEVKKKVFAELEKNVRPDAIICSNTSALSITEMSKSMQRPERLVGMHFFNPVNKMPLVEVIPGEKTSPEAIAAIFALSKQCGKTPILVKNCTGFLINRILLPYMCEALEMAQEGVHLNRIDKLLHDFGMPEGPFRLADEVGLDICYKVSVLLAEGYSTRMRVVPLLETLYKNDHLLGKKGGLGFYLHGNGTKGKHLEANPAVAEHIRRYQQEKGLSPATLSDQDILDRCLLVMLNEASRCLEEGIISKPHYLDMGLIMGTGFPPFHGGLLRYADFMGIPAIVGKLDALSTQHGERFKPSALLRSMARDRKNFYN